MGQQKEILNQSQSEFELNSTKFVSFTICKGLTMRYNLVILVEMFIFTKTKNKSMGTKNSLINR